MPDAAGGNGGSPAPARGSIAGDGIPCPCCPGAPTRPRAGMAADGPGRTCRRSGGARAPRPLGHTASPVTASLRRAALRADHPGRRSSPGGGPSGARSHWPRPRATGSPAGVDGPGRPMRPDCPLGAARTKAPIPGPQGPAREKAPAFHAARRTGRYGRYPGAGEASRAGWAAPCSTFSGERAIEPERGRGAAPAPLSPGPRLKRAPGSPRARAPPPSAPATARPGSAD